MSELMRLILLSSVFLGLFISLVLYIYFYRKYSQELTKAFHLLSSKQYLDINDYLFITSLVCLALLIVFFNEKNNCVQAD